MRPSADGENHARIEPGSNSRLIYRQKVATRIAHWAWAICLFFLLLSGLQIFNARPQLYVGKQSGFGFDNTVMSMSARNTEAGPKGSTMVFGHAFNTTGLFGMSYDDGQPASRGFPAWMTIPSPQDLATGRVVHFFFAWLLLFTLTAWVVASVLNGHLRRDIIPVARDFRRLPRDILNHLRFRFGHGEQYNALQKLSYAGVLLLLLPLMILTGLCMSPGMDAFMPWVVELIGGRQIARTIHFTVMTLLVLFFVVHILMVLAAGPINEMRSMITGWYRSSRSSKADSAVEH